MHDFRTLKAAWSSVEYAQAGDIICPASRYKASACLTSDHVFLLGGRYGTKGCRELWRYSLKNFKWKRINAEGLPLIEAASCLVFQDQLYCFGGQFLNRGPLLVSNRAKTSFRTCTKQSKQWPITKASLKVPRYTFGHSAVIFDNFMFIFGGFVDLQGSCAQFWKFDFRKFEWFQIKTKGRSPSPRHYHTAVVYAGYMYIFGGISNLSSCSDIWRFCFNTDLWEEVRPPKPTPGDLFGHSACMSNGLMFVFGGQRDGEPSNDLWCFSFDRLAWSRVLEQSVLNPTGCVFHSMTVLAPRNDKIRLAKSSNLLLERNVTETHFVAKLLVDDLERNEFQPFSGTDDQNCTFCEETSANHQNHRNFSSKRMFAGPKTQHKLFCAARRSQHANSQESLISYGNRTSQAGITNPAYVNNSISTESQEYMLPGAVMNTKVAEVPHKVSNLVPDCVEMSEFILPKSLKSIETPIEVIPPQKPRQSLFLPAAGCQENSFTKNSTLRRSRSLDEFRSAGKNGLMLSEHALDLSDENALCYLLVIGGKQSVENPLRVPKLTMWLCKIKP